MDVTPKTEKKSEPIGGSATPLLDCNALVNIWNSGCKSLPAVTKLTQKRIQSIRARLKEYPDPSDWIKALERIAASDFLSGRGAHTWRATFDWLLRPESLTKVLEGQYDNKKEPRPKLVI